MPSIYRQVYVGGGRWYHLLEAGRPVGRMLATDMEVAGCVGVRGIGTIESPIEPHWSGLAVSDTLPDPGWRRRAPSEVELAVLRKLATLPFEVLGTRPTAADSAAILRAFVYQRDGASSYLTGTLRWAETGIRGAHNQHEDLETRYEVFLIATDTGAGFTLTYDWHHRGGEENHEQRGLVDALDLDGNGELEFITTTSYYESTDYQILDARGNLWFQGGGSGC